MRRLPRKPLNPGWSPPREYLQGGLSDARTGRPRDELTGDRAAALGRQLLIEDVPLEAVTQLIKELDAVGRLAGDATSARTRLTEMAGRPGVLRYPLLAQLLAAATAQVRKPADLKALHAHLKRALTIASFSRVLAGASMLEAERAERRRQVRKHRNGH